MKIDSKVREEVAPQNEELQLPDLQMGALSWSELSSYLGELGGLGTRVDVAVRTSARGRAQRETGVERLLALLRDEAACSVQLRYVFQGAHWVDTLKRTSSGVRLVRMQSEVSAPGAEHSPV